MDDSGEGEMDLEYMLANVPEDLSIFDDHVSLSEIWPDDPLATYLLPASGYASLSIGDIEQLLMTDDDDKAIAVDVDPAPRFSDDFLLNSPSSVESHLPSPSSVSPDRPHPAQFLDNTTSEEDEKIGVVGSQDNNDNREGNDVVSKKRRRQLRNRDAAVRSRERKKSYVKDLEMKSKFYEAECKRLGMILQCCFAENQALRLSLQNRAFGASMTMQESAVLLLESLLLGSLLWLLVIMSSLFLLIVPSLATLSPLELEALVPMEDTNNRERGLPPRKAGRRSKASELLVFSFTMMMGKRCKASRWRIKPTGLIQVPT